MQLEPQFQDQPVVLAGFDRAQHAEVGLLGKHGGRLDVRRRFYAQWRNDQSTGRQAFAEAAPNASAVASEFTMIASARRAVFSMRR